MKKLLILKSLVDFIWIVTCIPVIPVLLFIAVYMFIDPSILEIPLEINNSKIEDLGLSLKISTLVLFVIVFIGIYCFYVFRKTLRYFQKHNPFSDFIINSYNTIGNLLVFSGITASVLFFVIKLVFESRIEVSLGLSPYIFIVCLGLFFMVLSEVFKVAKIAKEENQLTI
ncbi:DUF2975 domain-containing protein [Psychroserpens burtonensis]|uniref:DUF2975 domain-containing protein n=1 Tax=Psychroserpens burtonensis TaxID=49278 RepID=A0A5C7B7V3_9FLAO|nr:DUF2975 domain-containing protein [Psychroserpens burtonensis]TXE17817.1 DUF2975 domain-containing protein [Psychroserpens burtonensis]